MKRTFAVFGFLAAAGALTAQNPGGKMVETKEGTVFMKFTPTPWPARERSVAPDAGGELVRLAPAKASAPSGPAVVDAAYVTYRGSVVKLEAGESITILDARTNKERRVLLAKGAAVPEALKAGDAVSVRVPLEPGARAEKVELQKAPPALDPKSKFTTASAPAATR